MVDGGTPVIGDQLELARWDKRLAVLNNLSEVVCSPAEKMTV